MILSPNTRRENTMRLMSSGFPGRCLKNTKKILLRVDAEEKSGVKRGDRAARVFNTMTIAHRVSLKKSLAETGW